MVGPHISTRPWPQAKKPQTNRFQVDYGEDWAQQKELCKRRAGYRCEQCGWTPRRKRERALLHAHHRLSRRRGGSNALNNLVCLCVKCHAIHHPHMRK